MNHKRARICKPAMAFVTDIDIDRYEFFCGYGVRVPQAAFYKIER